MDVFIFPGQGSQRLGMGADLFDEVEQYRTLEDEIDATLGYSLRTLCMEDPEKRLNQTAFTQPALYVANALHHYKAIKSGLRPQLLAGHSLGEYNALLASGVFDFMTGLQLVRERGRLMSQADKGGMAAVLGLHADFIIRLIQDNGLTDLDIANFNSHVQTVISGPINQLEQAATIFNKVGAEAYIPLPVSAAFHSRYMAQAGVEFERFLSQFAFCEPEIPIISNVTARPYRKGNSSTRTKELLVKQISHPVQWTNTVLYLLGRGATRFHEVGPGEVLSRLVEKIRQR